MNREFEVIIRTTQVLAMKKGRKLLALTVTLLVLIAAAVRGQSALDGFDPNANGPVQVVAVQPDGKILISGLFTTVLGVARNNIARLNPDGTLDTAFDPNANGNVFSIAVQADGKILLGGYFTVLSPNGGGAVTRKHIARLLDHPAFFTGEVALSNGVYYLQLPNGNLFGYYSYLSDQDYIYHFDMGYEYLFDANDGQSGIFFYDFASSTYFYTSPSYPFPYLYDFSLHAVLYYYPDTNNPGRYTSNPRYFYNFATGKIITK